MEKLYSDLAGIYDAMYQTFINYEAEFDFYSSLIHKYGKQSTLEYGSGSGSLAKYLSDSSVAYIGLDFSHEMIEIARKKVPNATFLFGDMRNFRTKEPVQSAIITGRTISYIITNEDLNNTFRSIFTNLCTNGVLIFDFIDASSFIPLIKNGKKVEHSAEFEGVAYLRRSEWKPNLKFGMDFNWRSQYYKHTHDAWHLIDEEDSIIRSFTLNEIEIFLTLNNFKIVETISRASYAFPTQVIVAEKIE